jgi:hypothetical protein
LSVAVTVKPADVSEEIRAIASRSSGSTTKAEKVDGGGTKGGEVTRFSPTSPNPFHVRATLDMGVGQFLHQLTRLADFFHQSDRSHSPSARSRRVRPGPGMRLPARIPSKLAHGHGDINRPDHGDFFALTGQ